MSLQVGDVVQLKSGSPSMIVNAWIHNSIDVEVCWFDFNESVIKTKILNSNTLEIVE